MFVRRHTWQQHRSGPLLRRPSRKYLADVPQDLWGSISATRFFHFICQRLWDWVGYWYCNWFQLNAKTVKKTGSCSSTCSPHCPFPVYVNRASKLKQLRRTVSNSPNDTFPCMKRGSACSTRQSTWYSSSLLVKWLLSSPIQRWELSTHLLVNARCVI